jgi:hypothetical protein
MSDTSTFVVFEHYKHGEGTDVGESFASREEAEAYIKLRFEHDPGVDYKTSFTIQEVEVDD